jgi:hypothetical protein
LAGLLFELDADAEAPLLAAATALTTGVVAVATLLKKLAV